MDGPKQIDVVYAYIMEHDDGTEIVPVIRVPEWDGVAGVMLPLIGADVATAHAMRRVILQAPELTGRTLTLTKFSERTVVEVLKR